MIVGIGTDLVTVTRFARWQEFSPERLMRVFTHVELSYAQQSLHAYNLERLAARYAAKEAFFKAFSAMLNNYIKRASTVPFLTVAPLVGVHHGVTGIPQLIVAWSRLEELLQVRLPSVDVHLSLTHERGQALAFVVITLT